jgi:hypothetical protein
MTAPDARTDPHSSKYLINSEGMIMRTAASVIAASVMLSGCASWSTYNKQRDFSESTSSIVFADAKQRAVISNEITDTQNRKLRRFCAEPSPDALSAIAATAGVNLSVPTKGELGYSQAFAEGAASIGLRTQSIQLLRDVMFSNCEAFINQGITGFGLETMQRRFQSTLVAVLAIEQLTGATKAPAVALGGQSTANSAQVLDAAIKLVADTEASAKAAKAKLGADDAAAASAKADLDTFVKAHAGDTASADYTAAKQKSDDANTAAVQSKAADAERASDLVAARAVRAAATTAGGSGNVAVSFGPGTGGSKLDATTAAAVSTAVVDIVKNTLELGFGREVCTTLFGQMMSDVALPAANAGPLKNTCLEYLGEGVAIRKVVLARYAQETESIARLTGLVERTMDLVANGKMSQARGDKLIDSLLAQMGSRQGLAGATPPPEPIFKSMLPAAPPFKMTEFKYIRPTPIFPGYKTFSQPKDFSEIIPVGR